MVTSDTGVAGGDAAAAPSAVADAAHAVKPHVLRPKRKHQQAAAQMADTEAAAADLAPRPPFPESGSHIQMEPFGAVALQPRPGAARGSAIEAVDLQLPLPGRPPHPPPPAVSSAIEAVTLPPSSPGHGPGGSLEPSAERRALRGGSTSSSAAELSPVSSAGLEAASDPGLQCYSASSSLDLERSASMVWVSAPSANLGEGELAAGGRNGSGGNGDVVPACSAANGNSSDGGASHRHQAEHAQVADGHDPAAAADSGSGDARCRDAGGKLGASCWFPMLGW